MFRLGCAFTVWECRTVGRLFCCCLYFSDLRFDLALRWPCTDLALRWSFTDLALRWPSTDLALRWSFTDLAQRWPSTDLALGWPCIDLALGWPCTDRALRWPCTDRALSWSCTDSWLRREKQQQNPSRTNALRLSFPLPVPGGFAQVPCPQPPGKPDDGELNAEHRAVSPGTPPNARVSTVGP